MDKEIIYNNIESYLLGTMNSKAKAEFEDQLNNDEELRKELELHRAIQSELSEDVIDLSTKLSKLSTESKLQVTNKKPKSAKRLSLIIRYASLAAVFALGLIFLPKLFQPSLQADQIYASNYELYPMALNQRSNEPDNNSTELNIAIQSYLDKNYKDATIQFDGLYKLEKNDVYLLYKGSAQQASGELKDAIISYDEIIKKADAKYIQQALWYRALALLESGEVNLAKTAFESLGSSHYKNEEVKKILKALQ